MAAGHRAIILTGLVMGGLAVVILAGLKPDDAEPIQDRRAEVLAIVEPIGAVDPAEPNASRSRGQT
jgi:hypothetical protein